MSRHALVFVFFAIGCGDAPSATQAVAKAVEPATRKEEAKETTPPPAKEAKKDTLENPWTFDAVRGATVPGMKVVYARSGTNAKGKKVDDKLTYVVHGANDTAASTSYTVEPDPGTNKASSQVASTPWSALSPLFAMDRPEETVSARESVTVPAGTFETVKMELRDFFGNEKTVWMIADKPGIYAKVIDHGNGGDENDKTEITHELVEIVQPPA